MTAIITTQYFCDALGLGTFSSLSSAQQAQINYLINTASAAVFNETGVTFTGIVTETHRVVADNWGEIRLSEDNISAMNSATDVKSGLAIDLNVPSTSDYILLWDGVDRLYGAYPMQVIDLNFTHGYSTAPIEVQGVVTEMCRRGWGNPSAYTKRRVGDTEVDLKVIDVSAALANTDAEQDILDGYKNTEETWHLGVRSDYIDPHDFARYKYGYGVYR